MKYGDLDGVFEHLDDLPPKQRQNLGEHRERVLLNRTMTYLRRDLELAFEPADLRQRAWDPEAVRVLFNQLEFRSLFARLPMAMGEAAPPPETDAMECVVTTEQDPAAAVRRLVEVATSGSRYVLEPRFTGAIGRSDLLGLAPSHIDREERRASTCGPRAPGAPVVRPSEPGRSPAGRRWWRTGPRISCGLQTAPGRRWHRRPHPGR